ncbi:MAG: polyprenyl synthetase family protein [Bacteroidales bacterium]
MYTQSKLKELVDRAIVNLSFSEEGERLTLPVKYILSMSGKRLRPVLSLMCCNLYRDKIDYAIIPSTGLEVFHNFTLVHDDIMDQAPIRRNFPTVHVKWNLNQAILSGDVMAFISNECFLQSPTAQLHDVLRAFNKAAIEVCIGQQLDMDFEKAKMVSEEQYLRMIELKTAMLLAASAKVGAILGEAPAKDVDNLYEFGRNLGLAFQIQDDLLDAYGDTRIFGKTAGGDIVANKKTFLFVKAIEAASGPTLKKLKTLFSTTDTDPGEKIKSVMEIYDSLKIKSITEDLANEYLETASGFLKKVKTGNDRKAELLSLVQSQVGRTR